MFVRRIVNITEGEVDVELANGTVVTLPPKGKLECCAIKNVQSLLGKVKFVQDLTEVDRQENPKQMLRD